MILRQPVLIFVLLAGLGALAEPAAQHGSRDPEFDKIPFNEWFAHGSQTRMKWTAHISRTDLSVHQRLMTQVEVQVDGAELARRSGKGQFVLFVQFTDEQGSVYQNHATIDLQKLDERIGTQDVDCTMSAFVLPGDYRVALAVYDSATGEHSTKEEKLRVAPLKSDPLPDMWRDLPKVEFTQVAEPPDNWYLPSMTGRLHLNVETHNPARVDVLVNLTPSERLSGSNVIQSRSLGVLIPSLKTIAQVDFRNASLNVELLDLVRRKVVFHQNNVHELHWPGISDALAEKGPGVIDLKSLEDRRHNAGFFTKEVAAKLAAAQTPRALIILSAPVAFEEGEDLAPISATTPADCHVFYIRYHVPPASRRPEMRYPPDTGRLGRRPMGGLGPNPRAQQAAAHDSQIDQLAPMLKPLAMKLFDVETPEQFRRALAMVLAEISSL